MDDFMLVRFALDNVRVPEIAEAAEQALERIIRGRPVLDPDSPDAQAHERARRRAPTTRQPPRARHLHPVSGQ